MKNKRIFEIEQEIGPQYGGGTVSWCVQATDLNELYFLLYQQGYKKRNIHRKRISPWKHKAHRSHTRTPNVII